MPAGMRHGADQVARLSGLHMSAMTFVAKKRVDRNSAAVVVPPDHRAVFELEDHGSAHAQAGVGEGQRICVIAVESDVAHREAGAEARGAARITQARASHAAIDLRGATAICDRKAMRTRHAIDSRIAGFSLSADAGATLSEAAIIGRLRWTRQGDGVIAPMNRSAGATAEAFADVLPGLKAPGWGFVTLAPVPLLPGWRVGEGPSPSGRHAASGAGRHQAPGLSE